MYATNHYEPEKKERKKTFYIMVKIVNVSEHVSKTKQATSIWLYLCRWGLYADCLPSTPLKQKKKKKKKNRCPG